MGKKERIDLLLVRRKLFASRERARAALMEGIVSIDGRPLEKAGALVDENSTIEIKESPRYVSRGGLKLEKAFKAFNLRVEGKVAVDVGASTGGFTDCLLQAGARRVIAIDVGYGQIALALRNDPRVYLLERTNVRYLAPEQIPELGDIATVDVSFISVVKLIDNLLQLLKSQAELVILVKPQFEAGKEFVGKKGVIKDPETHRMVILALVNDLKEKGLKPCGISFSPILGAQGNIEFLLYLKRDLGGQIPLSEEIINNVVAASHKELRSKKK